MSRTRAAIEHAAKADAVVAIVRARLVGPYVRAEEVAKAIGVSHDELVAAVERFKVAHRPKLTLVVTARSAPSGSTRRSRPRSLPAGVVVPPGQKWCPRCKTILALERFGRNNSAKDGKQARCSDCQRDACRESYERRQSSKATG